MDFAEIEDTSIPKFDDFHEFVRAKYGMNQQLVGQI
jgi:hypothetical protein